MLGGQKVIVGTGWATSHLTAWTGLENTTLTLYAGRQGMKKDSFRALACGFYVSRKGRTGGG